MNLDMELSKKKAALNTFLSYVFAAFTGGLGLLNWAMLRSVVQYFMFSSSLKKEAWSAVDSFTFVLFGILWLCFVLFSQYFYKKGTEQRRFISRVCLITSIQVWILALCQIIPLFSMMKWSAAFLYIVAEVIAGIVLLIVAMRKSHKSKQERVDY